MAETLGEFVDRVRSAGRWSRDDVAEHARAAGFDISGSYIADIEKGRVKNPSAPKIHALAHGLRLDEASAGKLEELAGLGKLSGSAQRSRLLAALPGVVTAADLGRGPTKFERLGRFIAEKRVAIGMDLHTLARASKIAREDLYNLELGTPSLFPDDKQLDAIMRALGLPPSALQLEMSGLSFEQPSGNMVRLPVYEVACGEPLELDEHNPLEIVAWDAEMTEGADAIMKVRGTSMIGCGYKPGDRLFVKLLRGKRPRHGDRVVAVIDGGVTCKTFMDDDLGVYLESEPDAGDTRRRWKVDKHISIVAVVVGEFTKRR